MKDLGKQSFYGNVFSWMELPFYGRTQQLSQPLGKITLELKNIWEYKKLLCNILAKSDLKIDVSQR